jgi:hypothetical protein
MEVVHARCAGLDVSKKDAKVCVRIAGAGRHKTTETVTTWGSTTSQVLALREHLVAEGVACTVMEATGDYWKPFYYLLEDAGIKLSSVASDILGVSGRAMLQALIAGNRDPAAMADLAKRRLRSKIPAPSKGARKACGPLQRVAIGMSRIYCTRPARACFETRADAAFKPRGGPRSNQ